MMKRNKDLRACIAHLKAMLASDTEAERKEALEYALKRVRQLGRKPNPSEAEVFRVIREVTAKLTKLFRR